MMKLSVALEMPVKWHCRKCGFEARGVPDWFFPAVCPACGESTISPGHQKLPENRWWRDSAPHHYDLASNAESYQYYFTTACGEHIGRSFSYPDMVPEGTKDAVEAMDELLASLDRRYFYSGAKEALEGFRAKLVEALPEHKRNHRVNRLHELEAKLYDMSVELEDYDADM